jgi:Skp family chaperone for outer membrane proteins
LPPSCSGEPSILKDSITNLFAGDAQSDHSVEKAHQLARQVYQHPLIRSINQESRGFVPNFFRGITWLISRGYRWMLRKTEGEFGDRHTAPSYIPREAFATALLEQLGAKYFVERLVEAKFSDFMVSILERVKTADGASQSAAYQDLQEDLKNIEKEFIENNIDLNSALQSISHKLDNYLGEEDTAEGKERKALRDWKTLVFIMDKENNLERTIKNIGLKPTLQEIVDSIDKNSKTFRTYQARFHRYEQERFKDVRSDLRDFNTSLLVFLEGILSEPAAPPDPASAPEAQTTPEVPANPVSTATPEAASTQTPKRIRPPNLQIRDWLGYKIWMSFSFHPPGNRWSWATKFSGRKRRFRNWKPSFLIDSFN